MNRDATDLAGVRHESFETLGSTNAEALARARSGDRGPLWISARQQTAGRGRRGSVWTSDTGNLFASLLLTDPSPPGVSPQLSFVAGLAVHDAVAAVAPQIGPLIALKWPNDLLIGGKKAAGLLIEGDSEPAHTVVVGIGVNCRSHPSDTPYPATDLAAEGALVTAHAVLAALADAMQRRIGQWQAGAAFAAIRADWLKRAGGIGEPIRVRLPGRELSGRFEGLDEAGRLLVATGNGTEAITAGEVFALGASRFGAAR